MDWYPNAIRSVWMPSTMCVVMLALRKNKIGCHFCHNIILQRVGTIALQLGAGALQDYFVSESDAND